MNREILLMSSPTARVAMLCEELLADGSPHTRKDMVDYIEKNLQLLGIEKPNSGCISGGIWQAVKKENCIKLGTALYQYNLTSSDAALRKRSEKAINCLQSAVNTLTALAREIDYVTADDVEIDELNNLKYCIKEIEKMCEKF